MQVRLRRGSRVGRKNLRPERSFDGGRAFWEGGEPTTVGGGRPSARHYEVHQSFSPTLEVDCHISDGSLARVVVPSGPSTCVYGTLELRDGGSNYLGNGVAKVKRKYSIAPSLAISEGRSSNVLLIEGRQREPNRLGGDDIQQINKSQVDADLSRMRSMTQHEAAVAAAQGVAEAEIATAEAEEAMRQAEADAEAAKAFAEAACLMLKKRDAAKMWTGITA